MLFKKYNILLYIIIIYLPLLIYSKNYSVENDYFYILNKIKTETKIKNCTDTINNYEKCLINYHDETIPDFNNFCDIYSGELCTLLLKDIDNNLIQCEKEYHTQLVKVLTNVYNISKLFCFRGKNNEFCPISKIFQKSKTVKTNVKGDDFYSFTILHNYCLDESCSQYIDESYIGIYSLYSIGIIDEENIMSSLKYIRDFIESPDCYRIRKTYGNVNADEKESFSSKQISFSIKLIIILILLTSSYIYIF